jgi:hypothetical protein
MYRSFADCMYACAANPRCSSVDYRARDKKCYLSTHLGEPSVRTPGFSSAYSLGHTGACSGSGACCGATALNATRPVVPAALTPALPDVSCGNQGLS